MSVLSLLSPVTGPAKSTVNVPVRYTVALWLAASTLAFLLCMYDLSATLVEGVFLPADHDSFYHARRILDAIPAPFSMYQFDPRIHAPEGSWITWPWAYDMMMAWIAKSLMAITGAKDPMSVLSFVAPAWVFVNAALLLGITVRLRFSFPLQVIALLCYSLSTLTRLLHRAGMLDHHYVEHTFVLALLFVGLGWLQRISERRQAILLGIVLGAAPAFHNGLFVLQFPLLITFACLWCLRRPLPLHAVAAFAIALVVSTALFLLPSEPFRQGMFSFYLHSWFHLYIAVCTAIVCVVFALCSRTSHSIAALAGICLLLTIPIVSQIVQAGDFLFAKIIEYDKIQETQSIFRYVMKGEFWRMSWFYSLLVWLLPLGLAYSCWRLRSDRSDSYLFFVVMSLFGGVLLLRQVRFEYFGSFAMYLPWCLLANDLQKRSEAARRIAPVALGTLLALAYLPSLSIIRPQSPLGTDNLYVFTRQMYPALHRACATRPGVVLAEYNEGHFITYHSDCSVIADGFILTRQHQEKVLQARELLDLSLNQLLEKAPYVRYILVRRADDSLALGGVRCWPNCPENAGLRQELLAGTPPYPPQLKLLAEANLRMMNPDGRGEFREPFARLFEIVRPGEQ
jgi:hypothetical protein